VLFGGGPSACRAVVTGCQRRSRVTLGLAERQQVLGDPVDGFCGDRLDGTVFGLLHRERGRLFPDETFGDLFTTSGRRSIPPSVVACVLVLKQLEGLSDVEAADRFTYNARWRHACGVGGWETSLVEFDRTVLVRFRMRLDWSVRLRPIRGGSSRSRLRSRPRRGWWGSSGCWIPHRCSIRRGRHDGHGHPGALSDPGAAQVRRREARVRAAGGAVRGR
jgi:hypothetical protein